MSCVADTAEVIAVVAAAVTVLGAESPSEGGKGPRARVFNLVRFSTVEAQGMECCGELTEANVATEEGTNSITSNVRPERKGSMRKQHTEVG